MAYLHRLPRAAGDRNQYSPSASVQLEPAVVRRAEDLTENLRFIGFSAIAAAHAPSVVGPVFSQVVEGDVGFPGTAGSGEPVAKFDDLSVDRLQQGCCWP
jgi:hypothetical protein